MNLLTILLISAVVLLLAYRIYGNLLARLLKLDPTTPVPAVTMRDDNDYMPIEPKFLLSQHFSAIAAAGPIVGPILAGVMFGWAPALIWILVGSVFIGGVHDITALIASVRHKARSIAEVVAQYMTKRSYLLFLTFIWVALVYIIVAFTDVVAGSFVGEQELADGSIIRGGGTATSSLLYLALPIIMGLLLRYTKLTVGWATIIFLPLVLAAIYVGPLIPFDLAATFGMSNAAAVKTWDVLLLVYCLIAAVVPVWMLLQPRGHLGGYFLFIAMGAAMLGILIGGVKGWVTGESSVATINFSNFKGWTSDDGKALVPMLFITIACGACSGFHCLIASGTTSKQLRHEGDAKLIGYGAMLMEGIVAIVSLGCVMILMTDSATAKLAPGAIYANGLGTFLGELGIPMSLGYSFGLLAFTTFVYDTLDVCTRLGRYIIEELTGLKGKVGAWVGTGITAIVPLIFLLLPPQINANGKPIPAWRVFWDLFGASNQLLAALALVGITVWLWRTRRQKWVWLVTGLPAVWMYIVSMWALCIFVKNGFFKDGAFAVTSNPVPWAATVLIALAVLVLIEAVRVFIEDSQPPKGGEMVVPAGRVAAG